MRYKDKLNHNFFFNLFVLTFFFLLFFTKFLISAEVQNKNDYFCENVDPSKFLNQKSPSHIIIETNNPRRWVTNLFTLHLKMNEKKYQTHNKEWFTFKIDENFKKNSNQR